jgi:hypothetical protein
MSEINISVEEGVILKKDDCSHEEEEEDGYLIKVSESMPTLMECYDFVNVPSCCAISSFCGDYKE